MSDFWDYASKFSPAALLYNTYVNNRRTLLSDVTGKTERDNSQQIQRNQIDYNEYLRQANERALADWHRHVPNREIKYPEFSYAGQIYAASKNIANSGLTYDSASANYNRNVAYRYAGLYGISSKFARFM